jgi:hypothetical protein
LRSFSGGEKILFSQTPYEHVKETLPKLTQTQLKDLSNRCKALLSRSDEKVDEDWILEGLITELRLQGISVPSIAKIKSASHYPSYAAKSQDLRTSLETKYKLTKIQKRQLSKICIKCLIEHVRGFSDVSLWTLSNHIDEIPQALDKAFPGYLSSNLLMFLLKNTAGEAD